MSFLRWIIGKSPDVETPPPAWTVRERPILPLPLEDDPDTIESMPISGDSGEIDLEPVYIALEYTDAQGAETLRRVTLLKIKPGPTAPLLSAVCHERKALRQFRTDRIKCFVDPDGITFTAEELFLDLFDIDLARIKPRRAPATVLRAPITVLMAASHCDGHAHSEEIDTILRYAETELFKIGESPTIDDMNKMPGRIRRLRPQRSGVERSLKEIVRYPGERVSRFYRALEETMNADGEVVIDEMAFLEELRDMRRRIERL